MPKPIIAMSLSGIILKSDPWEKAHVLWFKHFAEKLNDKSVEEYAAKENWFDYVDEVMEKVYPELNDEERTEKARQYYFESVVSFIKQNGSLKNEELITLLRASKEKFSLGLITTTIEPTAQQILELFEITDLFDFIETSFVTEKNDKVAVFSRFIEKRGKPALYIGSKRKETFDFCSEKEINCVFLNFENEELIEGIKTVASVDELRKELDKL